MKILILAPLFPPDTTASARYTKELASRLSLESVTVLLYGHLPERVQGVSQVCVDKRQSVVGRAYDFFVKLVHEIKRADWILIQNGPSVELPTLLASLFFKKPMILMTTDEPALVRTKSNWFTNVVHFLLRRRCAHLLCSGDGNAWPGPKPIIHPLEPYPEMTMKIFANEWKDHLQAIRKLME